MVAQGIRFAFYGRTSTAVFQDPVTVAGVAAGVAEAVIANRGVIVAEFFDVGCSRQVSWEQRNEAAAPLEQARSADPRFDAVVVGEFERAVTDRQFEHVAQVLRHAGVRVWLPEAGGPVELDDPTHRVLMTVLAAQSQREVVRARHRTLAMTAQTVEQGRFLGGVRPTGTAWWTLARI